MRDYQTLDDTELLQQFRILVGADRDLTAEIVACLAEIEEKDVHLAMRYTSLHTFCVEEFGFSDDVAYKRVRAARASRRWPQLIDHLRSGQLSLAAVVTLAPHLPEHPELIEQSLGRSSREVEALVAAAKPDPNWKRGRSEIRPVGDGLSRVTIVMTDAQVEKLKLARGLDRHRNPDGDLATVVERAVDLFIADRSNAKFATTDRPRKTTKRGRAASSRRMPAADRRTIVERDGLSCSFVGPDGRRCGSTDFLEIDHVTPVADGGASTADNGRILCRSHNQFEARQRLGVEQVEAGKSWAAILSEVRAKRSATPPHDRVAAAVTKLFDDATSALRNLGFSPRQVASAVATVGRDLATPDSVQEVIRPALQYLMSARQREAPQVSRRGRS